MKQDLITVVETASFITDAKACMSDSERTEAINMIRSTGMLSLVVAESARFVLLSVDEVKAAV